MRAIRGLSYDFSFPMGFVPAKQNQQPFGKDWEGAPVPGGLVPMTAEGCGRFYGDSNHWTLAPGRGPGGRFGVRGPPLPKRPSLNFDRVIPWPSRPPSDLTSLLWRVLNSSAYKNPMFRYGKILKNSSSHLLKNE